MGVRFGANPGGAELSPLFDQGAQIFVNCRPLAADSVDDLVGRGNRAAGRPEGAGRPAALDQLLGAISL
jgi:hypothetical protein